MKRTCFLKVAAAIWMCLLLAVIPGCERQREKQPPPAPEKKRITLKIGIIPEQNLFKQKRRYEPLIAYLDRQSGVDIELAVLSRYGNIISNFTSMGLDGAFFGSFTGALALKRLNVEPLARPETADGQSTYFGLIFVRKDSGIRNGADMRGKRFAFVDKATTAGWLLPLYFFQQQGITDYTTWFQETYFAGTHEDTIHDVLDQKADIGAAKNTVFFRLAADNPRVSNELAILTRSPDVPENGLAVRADLDAVVKAQLRDALLHMDQSEEGRAILQSFGAARFIPTTAEDYRPVLDYATSIGLDLATYEYYND